ncbi:uncharacterized protein PFL1_00198 [Pseudozyma flocculosa PF-1]|uniref:uncharacterized protein n=1 Tax=Pseudozyma flocculosa PF-1 TaxID=1277687 RepID=UPI0004561A47|nr:uncharacterized protein PFL1_00198 [Pseudozyma flocculosa PF-1]EPQ32000.1 hypothetical protein PFL1_00198 [Pseudozyma flocculosa PF-1]
MHFTRALSVLPLAALATSAAICKRAIDPSSFKSEGLVAIGRFPADLRDSNGETLGGLGSAAGLVPGKFQRRGSRYSGSFYLQPDRGYNVDATIDYAARHHRFDFEFEEYTGSDDLAFSDAIKRFDLEYKETLIYHELTQGQRQTTGLNPAIVRQGGLTGTEANAAPLGAANGQIDASKQKISVDAEGFVANPDGTFWVSDEYGPYIYKLAADGTLLAYIPPPAAAVPRIGGQVNFTAETDPDTGRAANQGLEGLSISFDGNTLYSILQGGTIQDGGKGAKYLRLFEYDVSALSSVTAFSASAANPGERAKLVGEYVVEVPTSKKGKARGVSELIYFGPKTLGLLVRDGNGFGDSETDASYKHVDVIDLSSATNLANNAKYDSATGAVAPGGKLAAGIQTAGYYPLIDFLADLPRFGMHAQAEPVDDTLVAAKLESLILLPTLPPAPTANARSFDADEYFIVSFSDNDFQTKNGFMRALGAYSAAYPVDVQTQAFVFKVKLPGVDRKALLAHLGLQ